MRTLEFITFICFTTLASASVMPPPPNDLCANPTVLTATGTYAFATTSATTTVGPADGICPARGHDIWFSWTPTQAGIARFETCSQTTFDTNIAVWNNGPCPVGNPMVCDDDACGNLESSVTWTTQPGVTYTLQLGSSGGGPPGTGTFLLDFQLPPANDDCGSPIDLGSSGSASYDNASATTSVQGQNNPNCTNVQKDLWYKWTATQNGTATLETCGQTGDDTVLAVYAGVNCPAATALACDDDSCGSQSTLTWSISAGASYTLQIGSSAFSSGGMSAFSITETGSGATGTLFCPGDGTGAACPCGNDSPVGGDQGCASSLLVGGALRGSGGPSIANDTFVLTATGVPNGPGLYFQGSGQQAGGAGIPFGDGLLCVAGTLVRMGVVFASSNTSAFPSGALPSVSVAGGASSGSTLHYQLWYRDADLSFCPPASFNLTNGVSLTWAP